MVSFETLLETPYVCSGSISFEQKIDSNGNRKPVYVVLVKRYHASIALYIGNSKNVAAKVYSTAVNTMDAWTLGGHTHNIQTPKYVPAAKCDQEEI